ncbi:MAG: AAA-like domain-containing protein [Fimbriimonadaceae bacterium]|nr:AAA-like domain-containing protein [Fimbriimonadaceae bacterium]QYK58600.1 MAG: AAA-like domain-containing protein [Fimbriimonadaceae bacterium]
MVRTESTSFDRKPFFQAGGTLPPDSPSYVERPADRAILTALLRGEYVYVLDSRQKGKSSLVARTAVKLAQLNHRIARIDLQRLGSNLSAEQWYAGLLNTLGQDLGCQKQLFDYWKNNQMVGPLSRWVSAVQNVVLELVSGPVTVFIDEIDFVRSLPFSTDEFFSGIRGLFNARSQDPRLGRLSFCLVGVATPDQLVKNVEVTPFNIGTAIELTDLTLSDVERYGAALLEGRKSGLQLVRRVFHWTHGHPYLTQFLCQKAMDDLSIVNASDVDSLVRHVYFGKTALDEDANLADTERRMLETRDPLLGPEERLTRVLSTYANILKRKPVMADDSNPVLATLRLSGACGSLDGRLVPRNRIYRQVFDHNWIRANLPKAEQRRQQAAARQAALRTASVAAVVLGVVAYFAVQNARMVQRLQAATNEAQAMRRSAERTNYFRDMLSLRLEVERKNWIGIGEMIDRQKGSPDKGWEWDYWSNYLGRGQILHTFDHPVEDGEIGPDGALMVATSGGLYRIFEGSVTPLLLQNLVDRGPVFLDSARYFGFCRPEDTEAIELQIAAIKDGKLSTTSWPVPIIVNGRLQESSFLAGTEVNASSNGERLCAYQLGPNRPERMFSKPWPARVHRAVVDHEGSRIYVVESDQRGPGTLRACRLPGLETIYAVEHEDFRNPDAVSLSRDGRLLAMGQQSPFVSIIDSETGRHLRNLIGHGSSVQYVRWLPDSRRLLTASADGTAAIWEAETGRMLQQYVGSRDWLTFANISLDGQKIFTGSRDRTVRVWPVQQHPAVEKYKLHDREVFDCAWLHDSRHLVTVGTDGKGILLDTLTGKIKAKVHLGQGDPPFPIAVDPRGRLVALGGEDGTLSIIDRTGNPFSLKKLEGKVVTAKFSPSGEFLAAGSISGDLKLYQVRPSMKEIPIQGHETRIQALGFSSDNLKLVSSSGKTLRIWDIPEARVVARTSVPSPLRSARFSMDGGRILVSCMDGTARVLSSDLASSILTLSGHRARLFNAIWNGDESRILTWSFDGSARIWDAAKGQEIGRIRHQSWVPTAEFTPDGNRILTASADKTARLSDTETGQPVMEFLGHSLTVFAARMCGDRSKVATVSSDGTVQIFHGPPPQFGPRR